MAREKLYITEVNCETGETTYREFTEAEYEQFEIDKARVEAEEAARLVEEQAKAEIRASALAKLAALGLTEEEAKAIAG